MRKNQQLVIVLPEGSEELPIRIVRGSRSMELRLCLCPPDGEERHINETCPEKGNSVAFPLQPYVFQNYSF